MNKKKIYCLIIATVGSVLAAHDRQNNIAVKIALTLKTSVPEKALRYREDQPADESHLLKRLQRATHMLKVMDKSGTLIIPSDIECQENSVRWSDSTFYTMQMIMCIDHLCMYKTIEPLLCTWSSLIFSNARNRTAIIQEFAKAMLVLMHASLQHRFSSSQDTVLMRSSYDIKTLDSLSLEELLAILDLLVDEIPEFLEKLELTNETLTWHDWIKKYWLIAPLTAAMVGIKIYLSYSTTHAVAKIGGV